MSFVSFGFLGFLLLSLAFFHLVRTPRARRRVLGAANFAFLGTFIPDPASALAMLGFVVGSFALVAAVQTRRWPRVLWVTIPIAIAFLAWVKRYAFLGLVLPDAWLGHGLTIVGVSYMTFKTIHVLVDRHEEQLPPVHFWPFVHYQIGFFSLVSGPIQRYGDYLAFWDRIDRGPGSAEETVRNWGRVLGGIVKIGVPGALALAVWEAAMQGTAALGSFDAPLWRLCLIFYAYPVYIYFNFSGYCDVVIGAAGMFGMRQVENFDRPWLARNMIDFWDRWHMSLTAWIRDYVFLTSYKAVVQRWPAHARSGGVALLFGALLLAGIWHGSSWNFVVFGLVHGLGVAAARVWTDTLKQRLGRRGLQRYDANPWIRRVAVVATFHYACFSFLFFIPGLGRHLSHLASIWGEVLS